MAAARRSASALLRGLRDRGRRHLPGASCRASRSSRASRRCERAVHRAQHRRRPGRRTASPTSDTTQYKAQHDRDAAVSCATTPRRSPASGCSTPRVVAPTFRSCEQVRQYYAFPDALDVDRYTIDGKLQRHGDRRPRARPERSAPPASATGSTTTRSTPTASASSRRTATSATTDGKPVFFERDIPPTGALGHVRAADLLRRAVAGLLDRRRAPRAAPRGARLPGQQRHRAAEHHLHRQRRRRASASFSAQAGLRDQVPAS